MSPGILIFQPVALKLIRLEETSVTKFIGICVLDCL